ncbi:ComEC/Rec2 family competence protein [Clostridium celatum]|nr:MBL fold metallo-hydrolase [Clostridium celatum]MCE9655084.1 MBL fold metallo-hydrolase [Clostridium celatum]
MKYDVLNKISTRFIIILCVIILSVLSLVKYKSDSQKWIDADVTVKMPFEISILDIGKADFILIEIDGSYMVIDSGTYDDGEKIYEYLNFKEVKDIEYFILTHNDKDHIGGSPFIIENFNIKNLIQANYKVNTNQYNKYLDCLEVKKIKPILLKNNMEFEINDAKIKLYPTKKEKYEKSNDYSIIISIEYGEYKYLFAADAEEERMKEFVEDNSEKYTFLKMPHHGIYSNYTEEFLSSVEPRYAIVTCSKFRYPNKKTIDLLEKYNIKTFYTSSGDIIIKSDGEKIYFNQN